MAIYQSGEDYLEKILMLNERLGYARSMDIASELKVSKPSVSIAVKKLREDGYVEMDNNGHISLTAEGRKESAVLEAEAKKQATILAAEAEKEKEIKEAEGKAEAIRAIHRAQADGLKDIKEAGADEAVIRLKSLEAFQAAADGQATKIIIPSEIAGLAGLAKGVTESLK